MEDKYLSGFIGYYARTKEMISLHENQGFETITLAGVEPCISADDDSYNSLTGERRNLWLDILYEVSRDPAILESSRHVLYIGRKQSNRFDCSDRFDQAIVSIAAIASIASQLDLPRLSSYFCRGRKDTGEGYHYGKGYQGREDTGREKTE